MTNSAKNLKEPDWKTIRKLYENKNTVLKELAANTGLSSQKIVAFARKAGWKPRTDPIKQQRVDDFRDQGLQPTRLAARLKRLIAREIDSIETETHNDRPAADAERDARRLASLVRSLEKLSDIKAAKAKREGKDDDDKSDDKKGGQDMRAELARRLARIAAGEPAPKFSGELEPDGN
jgi:hypothetical protein